MFYSFLPPFHSMGFTVTGILPLVVGGKGVYAPDPTDTGQMLRDIVRYRPTIICSAPTFLAGLFQIAQPDQLRSLRLIVSGAEKAPPYLFEKVKELGSHAHLLEGYGITECSPILTLNRLGEEPRGVGYPVPGVELLIVHHETHQSLPRGQEGLILARGPNVFIGYLGDPGRNPFLNVEGKQWYNTGDLGSLDEAGALTLSGRLKRFVKIGGEMVSLPAIEAALEEIGKAQSWGGSVASRQFAVIPRIKAAERLELVLFTNVSVAVEQVNDGLRGHGISNLARIAEVKTFASLPLTGSGKIDFRTLEEQVQAS